MSQNFIEIEYHVETMSLREHVNDLLANKQIDSKWCEMITKCFKSIVRNAELKPFLRTCNESENQDSYYQKYLHLEKRLSKDEIPDFFLEDGDFYDLEITHNVSMAKIAYKDFFILFNLNLSKLERESVSIKSFLDFQLYDNFKGNKINFCHFLQQLLEIDSKFYHLLETSSILEQWIQENNDFVEGGNLGKNFDNFSTSIDSYIENIEENSEPIETFFNDDVKIIERKDFKIEGKFTDDEITNYFSFLYKEKSFDNKPFLSENAVNEIFKKGLTIPAMPIENKFKLNCDLRFPKTIIDYAIHLFYVKNKVQGINKIIYFKFFGSYIEDYKKVLESDKMAVHLVSNFSGEKSPRIKFNIENYLPERFR